MLSELHVSSSSSVSATCRVYLENFSHHTAAWSDTYSNDSVCANFGGAEPRQHHHIHTGDGHELLRGSLLSRVARLWFGTITVWA